MVSISNADRDKAVEFLKAYAASPEAGDSGSLRSLNNRRMALVLARKLERKPIEQGGAPNGKASRKCL